MSLVIGIGCCGLIDIVFAPRAFDTTRPVISIFHANRFSGPGRRDLQRMAAAPSLRRKNCK
jgi:hypothetical protein